MSCELSDEIIQNVLKEYGTPQYLFDENSFINNYRLFECSMTSNCSNYKIAYSYKTNYTPYICNLVKQMGGYAEVVSDMELELALRIGYTEGRIIYNGPVKGQRSLGFLYKGGILNVDNIDELKRIAESAERDEKKVKVGLRLNLNVGQDYISRFGFDAEGLEEANKIIDDSHNLSLIGLHVHIGKARNVEAWKKRSKEVIKIVEKYNYKGLEFLDLGSGMYGDMDQMLAAQFSDSIPTYEEYAEASVRIIGDYIKHNDDLKHLTVFTEPGTTLISRYISFVTTVKHIKKINGKWLIGLDCSIYDLSGICRSKCLPIRIIRYGNDPVNVLDADFAGYTCLEYDIVYRGYSGNISVGDIVVFGNVGGYSNVTKPPFIMWGCGMTVYNNQGFKQIKRDESFDDVFRSYLFPEE